MPSNTQKAIRGMSSQTIITIVLGIVEIISFSIMSRLLNQEDFGYYAAVTAVSTIFASFSETGIGSAIIQKKELTQKFINNAFTISLIFGSILMFLLMILANPISNMVSDSTLAVPLMIISITLLCNCLSSVNTSIIYRRLEFLKVGLINLTSLVITTVVAIICAINGLGYYAILAKAVLFSLISLLLSYIFANTKYRLEIDKSTFHQIFGYSGWLMASVFFRNLAQQLDRLLMTKLLSVNSLGMYNRPKEFLNQITSKLGGIFDTALFPVLSQIQDNKISLRNSYVRALYYLNVASAVLSLLFIFNSQLIIRIFFGEQWLNIIPVFRILSISVVWVFDARLADCYLRGLGLTRQQFNFRVLDVFLKISGIILSYKYGIVGIAVSVLITDFIMVFMKHIYLASKLEISFRKGLHLILESLKVLWFVSPILLLFYFIIPESILGNVILCMVSGVTILIVFCFFPSIIGAKYHNEIYPILANRLRLIKGFLHKN